MTHDNLAWMPDSCTLPTAERPLRVHELDELLAEAIQAVDRVGPTHLRLALRSRSDLEARVRDLAARESGCCSFFAFTVAAPDPGQVTLDIRVDAAHRDILDRLATRATRHWART